MSTDHQKALSAAIHDAISKAVRDYKNLNPEARRIGVIRNIATFKRRPKEFSGFRVKAVALFLSEPDTLKLTNAVLAARLSVGMPGYKAPANVLTEKLRPKDKAHIAEMLAQRGIKIDLERANTPSKIKDALRALRTGKGASHEFRGRIAFTLDAVIVDNKRHPIHLNGRYPRIHAGKAMLNVDGLKALLIPQ